MNIDEILDINTIRVNLNSKNKEEVISDLVDILYDEEYIVDKDEFTADIYKREELGKTGIGNYIAIPHGRSSSVQKVGVAIGILDEEIEWETLDDKGVKVVILFSVGNDTAGAENHLKILSMFARKLGNDEVVANLLKVQNTQEVINIFTK